MGNANTGHHPIYIANAHRKRVNVSTVGLNLRTQGECRVSVFSYKHQCSVGARLFLRSEYTAQREVHLVHRVELVLLTSPHQTCRPAKFVLYVISPLQRSLAAAAASYCCE